MQTGARRHDALDLAGVKQAPADGLRLGSPTPISHVNKEIQRTARLVGPAPTLFPPPALS